MVKINTNKSFIFIKKGRLSAMIKGSKEGLEKLRKQRKRSTP